MIPVPSPSPILEGWLRALSRSELADLGARFARRAMELGLAVTLPDGGERAIPPLLSPVVVDPSWIADQVSAVAELGRLTRQVAVGLLAGPER